MDIALHLAEQGGLGPAERRLVAGGDDFAVDPFVAAAAGDDDGVGIGRGLHLLKVEIGRDVGAANALQGHQQTQHPGVPPVATGICQRG